VGVDPAFSQIYVAQEAGLFAKHGRNAVPMDRAGGHVPAQIEHGKYLVERVGMCGDCHSPRNERGEFVK